MPRRIQLNAPPTNLGKVDSRPWYDWFNTVFSRVGEGPLLVQGYVVASLPSATINGNLGSTDPFSSLIFVSDETGGATLAFSDGTNWRRVQDRAIVA